MNFEYKEFRISEPLPNFCKMCSKCFSRVSQFNSSKFVVVKDVALSLRKENNYFKLFADRYCNLFKKKRAANLLLYKSV